MIRAIFIVVMVILLILVAIQNYSHSIPSWLLQAVLWLAIILFVVYILQKKRKKKE
ncbi:putative membrane protein [Pullulanibacillus pueri]|uniref:Uncharacterized protein n=1 Tax=Pullulanibacillus pueri TaxID=1437324 RepID=A0A8J2ZXZ7_9BACL|nr:hypothetical protein [Pullulanibacillus pueri]MBM7680586.1 putative membrane protein [Pullulanibacillus pueri]GGH84016.1 hypothetical protein GCM10007096_26120 [Pullulanibacillus pueri]